MKLNIDGKTRYYNIFLVKMNMLNVEDPIVTVKCRTAIKAMVIYINECLSVMLESCLFDERIVYSPDKDSVCSKRGTTEIL